MFFFLLFFCKTNRKTQDCDVSEILNSLLHYQQVVFTSPGIPIHKGFCDLTTSSPFLLLPLPFLPLPLPHSLLSPSLLSSLRSPLPPPPLKVMTITHT